MARFWVGWGYCSVTVSGWLCANSEQYFLILLLKIITLRQSENNRFIYYDVLLFCFKGSLLLQAKTMFFFAFTAILIVVHVLVKYAWVIKCFFILS